MTQSYVSLPLNVKIFIVNSACHNGTDFWGRQKVKMIFHLQLLLRLKFVGLYRHSKYRLTFSRQLQYTGLFISPSGISDPWGKLAGIVTPKGSMTTEGETLQVSVLPYRCSICAPLVTSESSWQTFLAHARQSRPMAPAGLFVSQRTGSHSAGISCTIHELFCP